MFAGWKWTKYISAKRLWVLPTVACMLLIPLSQLNFIAFHTFAELTTVCISYVVFALGWSTYGFSKNTFLIFFACGYFWVGSLDLVHALVFPGVDIIVEGTANLSLQFWIVTRYLEAFLFLVVSVRSLRVGSRNRIFLAISVVSIIPVAMILLGLFPEAYVENQGLTNF